jgi:hypothetical protein
VRVVLDVRALETPLQLRLRAVEDDEVRMHLQDLFDVRIDKRADTRQLLAFWRIAIVAADRNHAIAGAHREEHLRRGGNDRNNSPRFAKKG